MKFEVRKHDLGNIIEPHQFKSDNYIQKGMRNKFQLFIPGSTLHGYLGKILARSCQDLGKILAKIVTRYCQELQDAMVRSYQESHVSKKNLTKKPNMARKIQQRSRKWQEKNCYELLDIVVESENH